MEFCSCTYADGSDRSSDRARAVNTCTNTHLSNKLRTKCGRKHARGNHKTKHERPREGTGKKTRENRKNSRGHAKMQRENTRKRSRRVPMVRKESHSAVGMIGKNAGLTGPTLDPNGTGTWNAGGIWSGSGAFHPEISQCERDIARDDRKND